MCLLTHIAHIRRADAFHPDAGSAIPANMTKMRDSRECGMATPKMREYSRDNSAF